jgi:hypothetical protein
MYSIGYINNKINNIAYEELLKYDKSKIYYIDKININIGKHGLCLFSIDYLIEPNKLIHNYESNKLLYGNNPLDDNDKKIIRDMYIFNLR